MPRETMARGPRRWSTADFNDDGQWVGDPREAPTRADALSLHRWASEMAARAQRLPLLSEQADRARAAADFYDAE
jgi:hypothetical protein